jgi:hypothetical protein
MYEYKFWYNHSVLVAVRHTGRPLTQGNYTRCCIKTLKARLNPICHLLSLLGAHHILHVSRIRVNIIVLLRISTELLETCNELKHIVEEIVRHVGYLPEL